MRTPAFQQFAERCAAIKETVLGDMAAAEGEFCVGAEEHAAAGKDYDEAEAVLTEAERHARLLHQIWEWANAVPERPYRKYQLGHRADGRHEGFGAAKAHVRSLLQPHAEE